MSVVALLAAGCASTTSAPSSESTTADAKPISEAVGPQYGSVHVYVDPSRFDDFVRSWLATFGGTAKPAGIADVTPTKSQTRSQLVLSPVGTLSVFGFLTPAPFPFGSERTGWLLRDFDAGIQQARASGAVLQVAPFDDPIGRDAVVTFPGGLNTQLDWHTSVPNYPALRTIPDNRVYLSPDAVDAFLKSYLTFSAGTVTADDPSADGALIGKPGSTFRQIRLSSGFGNTLVLVTDGHLPHPYGREVAGYAVDDVAATVAKATAAGAEALVAPRDVGGATSAVLQFPGGYIAEVHQAG
ncbi:glyoxalase [Mycobacterium hodleri]|uniref:Glyoxalase n=1 Tax=Mycolicibacterium hodleri TaxID=49897 RepID=A0A544VXU2_9MYCO|nr:glyoxalase [Mycolicibacterium hodleri]